jgi:S-adenosylmethionine decarboxylase proenzyme
MNQTAATAVASVESRVRPALGSQVVLDLYECETPRLDDIDWVKATLVDAALAAGATIVQTVFHKFAPWGISGVVVIAESHLAIHIWPENRYAAIDVFTCGENVRMDVASAFLKRAFQSKRAVQTTFSRGDQLRLGRGRAALQQSGKKPALVRSASPR